MAKRAPKATPPALTDAQVAARVTTIDDARQKLADAEQAAAAAKARLDGLPPDATDENRAAFKASADEAAAAVVAASAALQQLLSETVTLPPAEKVATVTVDLAALISGPGLAFITQDTERVLRAVEEALAAGDTGDALETLDEEIATAGEFIAALEQFQNALTARREQIQPQPLRGFVALQEGLHAVRVTGPKSGRRRAGRTFTDEAQEIAATAEEIDLLEGDPALKVERI